MSVNITLLIVTFGVMLLGTIFEKLLSKSGNETGAWVVGLVGLIIGFMIVIGALRVLINDVFTTFFYMNL